MLSSTMSKITLLFSCVIALGCGSASDDVNLNNASAAESTDSATTSDPAQGTVSASNDTADTDTDSGGGGGSSSSSITGSDSGNASSSGGKVWTVSEILAEPRSGGFGGTPLCGGEFGFKRCLCAGDVPSSVRYRPAVKECNGAAAAIFHDQYTGIFSVVVRDTQNRDRWPASGFNGCSASLANSDSPPNKCSAFKVQHKFSAGGAMFHCFGASGYSSLFSDVVRLTVKLADSPNSSDDPLERFCLWGPNEALN